MRRGQVSYFVWAAVGLLTIALPPPPVAVAASSIAITVGPDPAESITTQLGVTGTSEGESRIYLNVKPSGGDGCGANAEADDGTSVFESFGVYLENAGPFAHAVNWTFANAGSYLLCAWSERSEESGGVAVTSASQTIAVRPPHLSLSIQAPARVGVGSTFQISMTVQAETEREAYEFLLPSTLRGCPANAAAAYSTPGEVGVRPFGVDFDGGPTTVTDNETLDSPGSYLVCAYIEYGSTESVPEARASAVIKALRPLPLQGCVVPPPGPGQRLNGYLTRLRAAKCKLGRIVFVRSRRPHGTVLLVSPGPRTRAADSHVAVTLSSGPPPRRRRHRHHKRHKRR